MPKLFSEQRATNIVTTKSLWSNRYESLTMFWTDFNNKPPIKIWLVWTRLKAVQDSIANDGRRKSRNEVGAIEIPDWIVAEHSDMYLITRLWSHSCRVSCGTWGSNIRILCWYKMTCKVEFTYNGNANKVRAIAFTRWIDERHSFSGAIMVFGSALVLKSNISGRWRLAQQQFSFFSMKW